MMEKIIQDLNKRHCEQLTTAKQSMLGIDCRVVASLLLVITIMLSLALPAHAQSSGEFTGGSVKIGYDNQACSGSIEGAVRYNSSSGIEFCDGSAWASASNSGNVCTVPSDCTTIGATCADGSKFAGFVTSTTGTCSAFYVASADESASISWSDIAEEGTDTGADSFIDGRVNTQWIIDNLDLGDYWAMEACASSSDHGQNDWYLPAYSEMAILGANASAIGGFSATQYWVSTEYEDDDNTAYYYDISYVLHVFGNDRSNTKRIRCVRRE